MNDERANELFATLKEIGNDISDMKIILATQAKDIERNADDLQVHMKRTAALEFRLTPVEKHINMWAGVGKFVAIASTVTALAFTVYKLATIGK